jgi:hypothetical protein
MHNLGKLVAAELQCSYLETHRIKRKLCDLFRIASFLGLQALKFYISNRAAFNYPTMQVDKTRPILLFYSQHANEFRHNAIGTFFQNGIEV